MNGIKFTVFEIRELLDLYNEGKSVADIAAHFKKTEQSIYWWLKKSGVSLRDRPKPLNYVYRTPDYKPIEEMDLSKLPPDVMFRHENFIIP